MKQYEKYDSGFSILTQSLHRNAAACEINDLFES